MPSSFPYLLCTGRLTSNTFTWLQLARSCVVRGIYNVAARDLRHTELLIRGQTKTEGSFTRSVVVIYISLTSNEGQSRVKGGEVLR